MRSALSYSTVLALCLTTVSAAPLGDKRAADASATSAAADPWWTPGNDPWWSPTVTQWWTPTETVWWTPTETKWWTPTQTVWWTPGAGDGGDGSTPTAAPQPQETTTPVEAPTTPVQAPTTAAETFASAVTSEPIATTATEPVAEHTHQTPPPASTPVASTPVASAAPTTGSGSGSGTPETAYQCFSGSPDGYPTPDNWLSFDEIWAANEQSILESSGAVTAALLKTTIPAMASSLNFDPRFVLAVAMQESTGNPGAPCTAGSTECGLMQSGTATGSSLASIQQQITYGINGDTATGECGYGSLLNGASGCANKIAPGNYFMAGYLYNVGSPPAGCVSASDCNLNAQPVDGTKQYATDLANRVMGWNGEGRKSC